MAETAKRKPETDKNKRNAGTDKRKTAKRETSEEERYNRITKRQYVHYIASREQEQWKTAKRETSETDGTTIPGDVKTWLE